MNAQTPTNAYILGHADDELARLERQAQLFHDTTSQILQVAGVAPSMRVLDVGCGAGDVSMLASQFAFSGEVIGVDRSPQAVEVATRRAAARGVGNVSFSSKEPAALAAEGLFDAVIGRFLLLHFPDPAVFLKTLTGVLKPGGLVVFAEMDIRSMSATPSFPLLEKCVSWIVSLYEKSGLHPDMGSKLYGTFKQAGLTPELTVGSRIETGLEGGGLAYLIGTLQTMKPALIGLGIATPEELDLDRLTAELAEQMVAGDHCVVYPRLVGAWARI